MKTHFSRCLCFWTWMQICNHNMPPSNNFTVSWSEPHWRITWVNDAAPVCYMQTHHLSHRVRDQRYMWATVTRLKVTLPDKSNLLHRRERLSPFGDAQSEEWDWWEGGRASWWAVPDAPYLSLCLLLQHLGIYRRHNRLKQTDVTDWKLAGGFTRAE